MLFDNDMIERLFSLALDPKYNQYLVASNKNIDHMMDYRMMINNLAYDHQELSDRILKACNDNLKVLIADLWQQTRDYLEMFKSNANATRKNERRPKGLSTSHKVLAVRANARVCWPCSTTIQLKSWRSWTASNTAATSRIH